MNVQMKNDEFNQAKTFYQQILNPDERINLALRQQFICKRAIENFFKC